VSALQAHHAAGRLQTNELDQRIAKALTVTVTATAIALSNGAHLIWIVPLLWFAGPWHRHRPRIHAGPRELALPPITREGSRA
jgi:hypothetical protein